MMPKIVVEDELRKLIKEFFADDIMEWVGSDHHKQRDGMLEITYSYYYDNEYQGIGGRWYWAWTVCHPGYVRGHIEGRDKTLEGAVANFRKSWEGHKKEWADALEEFHGNRGLRMARDTNLPRRAIK